MGSKEKLKIAVTALQSLYHMLKTGLPERIHQEYINGILDEIGEEKEG